MSSLSKRLLLVITNAQLSYSELSKLTGIPKSALHRYATGETEKVPLDRLEAIAKATNTSAAFLMGWDEKPPMPAAKKGTKIPVLGEIAAGIPIDAIEDILDYEEIDEDTAKTGSFFGLRIKGDSMAPVIMDGDIVIVRQQSDIDSGDIAVVLVNGDAATCKKVIKQGNGIMLIGNNNVVYPPRFYNAKEIEALPVCIIGKVVEMRRTL